MDRLRISLNEELDCLHIRYSGRVSASDILESFVEVYAHPAYRPGIDAINDFSDALAGDISRDEMASMIEFLVARGDRRGARVAFVSPDDLGFGLSRMISSTADGPLPQDRAVFRSLGKALAWLGAIKPGMRNLPVPSIVSRAEVPDAADKVTIRPSSIKTFAPASGASRSPEITVTFWIKTSSP